MSNRAVIRLPHETGRVALRASVLGAVGTPVLLALLGMGPTGLTGWVGMLGLSLGGALSACAVAMVAAQRLVAPLHQLSSRVAAIHTDDGHSGEPGSGSPDGLAPPASPLASSSTGHELGLRSPDVLGDLVERVAQRCAVLQEGLEGHRQARRSAEQAEAYETEFLTTVSHELRTPLNAILGFTQVLLDEIDGPLSDGQREDVETIRVAGENLRDLVDEVLDLAAMRSGRFRLEIGRVEAGPVVREVARLLEGQRRGKPVRIASEVPEGLPPVAADPRRLRQILINLGTNALKFTDEGSVTLAASVDGATMRFTVRDTGSGIRREELAILFEEFTQVGEVRRKSQGSGLGLAICMRLSDLHGGRIEVQSVVGEGSAFHVCLPLWSEP